MPSLNADPVSPELRAVEEVIDRAHLTNALTERHFAEAAWFFLASCEDHVVLSSLARDMDNIQLSHHGLHTLADWLLNNAKWPMRWLKRTCPDGGHIPRTGDAATYAASRQLLRLSDNYLSFEAAYMYATRGVIDLRLSGNTIIPTTELRQSACYDAYDRLVTADDANLATGDITELLSHIAIAVRISGRRFSYVLSRALVQLAIDAIAAPLGPSPILPSDWQFSRYSVGDFQRFAHVLRALCWIHYFARLSAGHRGVPGFGYDDCLIVMNKSQLLQQLIRFTELPHRIVVALVEDLTYGSRGITSPDVVLQPLVLLTLNVYAIAPNTVINNSLERNFAVLMNRIPEERPIYTGFSQQREDLSRRRIVSELAELPIRHWHGNVPGWIDGPDIDLALIDDVSRSCILMELKSFVAPVEVREMWHRSKEIKEGIGQVKIRKELEKTKAQALHEVLDIDKEWRIDWAVVSESSVGDGYVQEESVPVVRTAHLIRRIRDNDGLAGIGRWLTDRRYLPREGRHFQTHEDRATIGEWTLEWYRVASLVEGGYT